MYWGPKFPRDTRREITPQRLAASKRFLAKERDRYALFAGEVAAEQPTPEERINNHDESFAIGHQQGRDKRARNWRKARQLLSELSPDFREDALTIWNRKRYPPDPIYLIELIKGVASGDIDPRKELADIERLKEAGRLLAEKIDHSKAAEWTAYYEARGPKP